MTLDKFFEAVLQDNEKSKLNEYELHNSIVDAINKLHDFADGDDEKVVVLLSDAICNSDISEDIIQKVAQTLA